MSIRARLELAPFLQLVVLLLRQLYWFKEGLCAVHFVEDVKELLGLLLPRRTPLISQDVANRFLVGSHPGDVVRDTVASHLAEVTFPLTSRALLGVPKAVRMKSSWTVIALHDSAITFSTDAAFDYMAI